MNSNQNAPAVEKAFEIIGHLEKNEAKTLAELASATGQPKSSALRILRTLISLGIVARSNHNSAPSYLLLKRLIPNPQPSQVGLRLLLDVMSELAAECEVSAEWFLPTRFGMTLLRKAEPPEDIVRVMAAEGFCFRWDNELDAITALGYAFFAESEPSEALMCYTDDGIQERLLPEHLRGRIKKARLNGQDEDTFWNDKGVKRIARVVASGGKAIGIISTARNHRPNDELRAARIRGRLERAAQDIALRCSERAGEYADV